MELIDKAPVVAEIERVQKNLNIDDCGGRSVMAWSEGFKNFLNALEVKEVDLEKEYEKYYEQEIDIQTFKLAKHFFELGLKVNNDAAIEKACDWLKTNVTYTHPRTGETKCVVNLNAFRDAMKGE